MKWLQMRVHSAREATEAISNIFHEAGASGVAIEDRQDIKKTWDAPFGEMVSMNADDYPDEGVITKAYFSACTSNQKFEKMKADIYALPSYGIDGGALQITVTEIDEEDWANAWKTYYHPVQASPSITIVPEWQSYEPGHGEQIVKLNPGMAFGTGMHPTTKMCVRALDKVIQPGDKMIDVGTGSGVLSIAAAKLGASSVNALDLDEVAVQNAKYNVSLNQVETIIQVRPNHLLDQVTGPVDLLVGNLLTEIILRFPNEAARVLKTGGYFIASGIIKANAQKVIDTLLSSGFVIEETLEDENWTALIAQNGR